MKQVSSVAPKAKPSVHVVRSPVQKAYTHRSRSPDRVSSEGYLLLERGSVSSRVGHSTWHDTCLCLLVSHKAPSSTAFVVLARTLAEGETRFRGSLSRPLLPSFPPLLFLPPPLSLRAPFYLVQMCDRIDGKTEMTDQFDPVQRHPSASRILGLRVSTVRHSAASLNRRTFFAVHGIDPPALDFAFEHRGRERSQGAPIALQFSALCVRTFARVSPVVSPVLL